MSATVTLDTEQDPRAIVGTRVFDAPRNLVFDKGLVQTMTRLGQYLAAKAA